MECLLVEYDCQDPLVCQCLHHREVFNLCRDDQQVILHWIYSFEVSVYESYQWHSPSWSRGHGVDRLHNPEVFFSCRTWISSSILFCLSKQSISQWSAQSFGDTYTLRGVGTFLCVRISLTLRALYNILA